MTLESCGINKNIARAQEKRRNSKIERERREKIENKREKKKKKKRGSNSLSY